MTDTRPKDTDSTPPTTASAALTRGNEADNSTSSGGGGNRSTEVWMAMAMMLKDDVPTTTVQDPRDDCESVSAVEKSDGIEWENSSSKDTPADAAQLRHESKPTEAMHVLEWARRVETDDNEINPTMNAQTPTAVGEMAENTKAAQFHSEKPCASPLQPTVQVAEQPALRFGFTATQRRDMVKHVIAIFFFKFAAQLFDAAFAVQVLLRFGDDKYKALATLIAVRYGVTAFGIMLVPPFLKHFSTKSVLSVASVCFALISAVLLVVDAATGGKMKQNTTDHQTHIGSWDPRLLFLIYGVSGIANGAVETSRRVVAIDIIGGNSDLLRRFGAIVHISYEGSAALGSFLCPSLIEAVGINYASFLTPICLGVSSFVWFLISALGDTGNREPESLVPSVPHQRNFIIRVFFTLARTLRETGTAILLLFRCFMYGCWLLCAHRKLVWLLLYSISLAAHFYFSTNVVPLWSTSVLGEPAWSTIIEGGYLLGKLVAGLLILALSTTIRTPLPWMRLDALAINLIWLFVYVPVQPHVLVWAWRMAAVCIPISISMAASDITLTAHLQATMTNMAGIKKDLSPLASVISVVSLAHLGSFILLSNLLGKYTDSQLKGLSGPEAMAAAKEVLKYIGGILSSVLCVFIWAITLIPKGAFHWNPRLIDDGEADIMPDHTIDAAEPEGSVNSAADLSEAETQKWIQAVQKNDGGGGASVINTEGAAPRLKFRKSLGTPLQTGDGSPLSTYFDQLCDVKHNERREGSRSPR